MSKSLSKRLEDLEDEIRILLTLQEIGNNGCHLVKGKSITRHVDGNVEHIEFEGSNCLGAKSICGLRASSPSNCTNICGPKAEKLKVQEPPIVPKTAKSSCICGKRAASEPEPQAKSDGEYEAKGDKSDGSKKSKKTGKGKSKKKSADKDGKSKAMDEQLQELQEKVVELENKLEKAETERSATLASNAATMKAKNEEIRANAQEVENLKKENEDLLARLKLEEEKRTEFEEKMRAAQEKEKKALTQKMERIELHAAKSTKKLKRQSEDLASAVRTRDDHIRKLSDTADKLVDSITEKENEKRRLVEAHKEAVQHFIEAQSANKKLLETNAALMKNQKDLQDKLQFEKQCNQKLTKQISQSKIESDKLKEEAERLRIRLKAALEGPKEARHLAKLEEKLRDSREREEIWLNEAAVMEAKLKELQEQQNKASESFDSELELMQMANAKLKKKYEKAIGQVEQLKVENEARIAEMKNDFEKVSADYAKKYDHLRKEKKTLQDDFGKLADASKRDREILEQLIERTKRQDEVVTAQLEALKNKDTKLANVLKESNNLKEQIQMAEKTSNELKNMLEEQKAVGAEVGEEIENLKAQLENEREECARKDVTIAEHICKMEHLQHELTNNEDKLKSAVEECQMATEEAKKAMEELRVVSCKLQICENTVAMQKAMLQEQKPKASEEGDGENILNRVAAVSEQFERKVALIEKEKQMEIHLVLKEKDQAVYAAKFATQKLLETVTDFQKQVDVHKQIQLMLARVLQEKEELIKSMQQCPPCQHSDDVVMKKPRSRGSRSSSCPYR